MDGFSYNNIFETKGIEYLIIITFLLLIIPFWIAINRKSRITAQIRKATGVLSAGILRIPQGLFYSKNHTWIHLEKSGTAEVGIDDFLMHVTGAVTFNKLKKPGDVIKKGELLACIDQNGKHLQINSPVSGRVMNTNRLLSDNPGAIKDDPYEKGWIYRIQPSAWVAETDICYRADEALAWSKMELERFKDFMAISLKKYTHGTSMVILQDGGELIDLPLSEMPEEVWQDFQRSFLNQTHVENEVVTGEAK